MPFKTKEEMFGDGGGFGPAVPFSTSNPPGTSAGNRGVQFGEQLTAAIANRTHYALALNDEDLNTRLAAFETGGLDAAYDNGSVGPSGGGREVTKDGGAIETTSALASQYADDPANAHFRANAIGDASRGGGFDARMALAQTAYAFMARRNMGLGVGGSTILTSQAATLNPASAGATIVRLGGGSVAHTAGVTGVGLLGIDFVEISGAGAGVDGVYFIHSLGPTNNDFILRRLDGTSPAFTADTAVTARFFRAPFIADYNFGGSATPGVSALAVGGTQSDQQSIAVVTNDVNGSVGTGTARAMSVFSRATTGVLSRTWELSGVGQIRSTVSGSLWAAAARDAEMRTRGGIVGIIDDRSAGAGDTHEVGLIFKDVLDGATWSRSALENWQRLTETAVLGIQPVINGTFAAPSGRVLLPDSDGAPAAPTGLLKWNWALAVRPGFTIVEMLSGANAGEFYQLGSVELTGASNVDPVADEINLLDLDGNPAALPTAGSFTFRFINRDVLFSTILAVLYESADSSVVANDLVAYGSYFGLPNPTTPAYDHVRSAGFSGTIAGGVELGGPGGAGTYNLREAWVLKDDGEFRTEGLIRCDGLTLITGTGITIPQTDRVINIDLRNAYSEEDVAGVPLWRFDRTNNYWELITLGGGGDSALYFPITWRGTLMETEVQVFASSGALHSVYAALQSNEPDWGTPANAPATVNANEDTFTGNNAWGELSINHSLGLGTNIALSTRAYAIRVRGTRVGDRVRALRHTIRYTSIGPGGIGS